MGTSRNLAAAALVALALFFAGDAAPSARAGSFYYHVLTGLTVEGSTDGVTFTALTLDQAFAARTKFYATSVGVDVTHVRVTATWDATRIEAVEVGRRRADEGMDLAPPVTNGEPSAAIGVSKGHNAIVVRAFTTSHAHVGQEPHTHAIADYDVVVNRSFGDTNADLAQLEAYGRTSAAAKRTSLELTPAFSAETTRYTATVDNAVTHAQVFPAAAGSPVGAQIHMGKQGQPLTLVTGTLAEIMALEEGANTVIVRVTAQDPSHTKVYVVVIQRRFQGPAGLQALRADDNTALSVTWLAPRGTPVAYEIEYKASTADEWTQIARQEDSRAVTIRGLAPGTGYDVRVRAWYAGSFHGEWTSIKAPQVQPAPGNVALEVQQNSLAVSWDAPPGAFDHYEVQYKPASRSDWRNVAQQVPGGSYTVHLLYGGTAYDVRVRGVNEIGAGEWSAGVQGTPAGAAVPAEIAAAGLQVSAGNGTLSLGWNEPSGEVTGYQVQYKLSSAADGAAADGDPAAGWVDAGHTGAERAITIGGLTNGTAYDVRMRYVFPTGYGFWSEVQGSPRAGGV